MNTPWLLFAIFGCVTVGLLGAASLCGDLFFRQQTLIRNRISRARRDELRGEVKHSSLFRNLASFSGDGAPPHPTFAMRVKTFVSQSGMSISVQYVLAVMGLLAFLFGMLTWLVGLPWYIVLPCVAGGASIPPFVLLLKRKKRMARLCTQLPEAFDVMARALRAGQSVPTAFQSVAQDFPVPISEEFAYCSEQQHLGIPVDVSLRDLARRTGLIDTQIFASAMIINHKVGGNLAEMLTQLASTMRSRTQFAGRVKALTGEGRMQALALTLLPIAAFLAVLAFNREYGEILLHRPQLLALTIGSQAIGAFCIHRIIQIKY